MLRSLKEKHPLSFRYGREVPIRKPVDAFDTILHRMGDPEVATALLLQVDDGSQVRLLANTTVGKQGASNSEQCAALVRVHVTTDSRRSDGNQSRSRADFQKLPASQVWGHVSTTGGVQTTLESILLACTDIRTGRCSAMLAMMAALPPQDGLSVDACAKLLLSM